MGDATMDDETQPMHPDDADESPLHSVKTGPTELAIANDDVRARSDALRDAARAAAAASEASKDRLVIPLAPMNPYQQAALEVPTGNIGGRKEGKGPKDRLESPEKKHKPDKASHHRPGGLGPTPLFGGGMSSGAAPVPKEQPARPSGPPEFYNLDPQSPLHGFMTFEI